MSDAISVQCTLSASDLVGVKVVLKMTWNEIQRALLKTSSILTFRNLEATFARALIDDKVPTVSAMISDLLEAIPPSTADLINSSRTTFVTVDSNLDISAQTYCCTIA